MRLRNSFYSLLIDVRRPGGEIFALLSKYQLATERHFHTAYNVVHIRGSGVDGSYVLGKGIKAG